MTEQSLTQILSNKNTSISQQYLPRYRRVQKKYQEISAPEQFSQLSQEVSNMVNKMADIIDARMKIHEEQLMDVFRNQIQMLMEDIKKTVKAYNQLIKQNNTHENLRKTRNQLEYFRYETMKLFQEGNCLRQKIKTLQEENYKLKIESHCQEQVLKNMQCKLQKANSKILKYTQCKAHNLDGKKSFSLQALNKKFKISHENQNESYFQGKDNTKNKHVLSKSIGKQTKQKSSQLESQRKSNKFPILPIKGNKQNTKKMHYFQGLKKNIKQTEIQQQQKQKSLEKIKNQDFSENNFQIDQLENINYLGSSQRVMSTTAKMKAQFCKHKFYVPKNHF